MAWASEANARGHLKCQADVSDYEKCEYNVGHIQTFKRWKMTSSESYKIVKRRRCRSKRPEELYVLTTHCAQLQFKLLQILDAPSSNKESLLQQLDDFLASGTHFTGIDEHRIMSHRKTQKMLIGRLKSQLRQLAGEVAPAETQLAIQLKLHLSDLEHFVRFLREALTRTNITTLFLKGPSNVSAAAARRLLKLTHAFDTMRVTHWGNIRADLELAVVEVEERSRSDVSVVRDRFAVALRDLAQHGLKSDRLHIWDVVCQVYETLGGERYNSKAVRRLAHSFDLDMVDARPTTALQLLLHTVWEVMTTHGRYRRTKDEHWTAVICAGLNAGHLSEWLRLVFSCPDIIQLHYHPWSYVINTGFEDATLSVSRLSQRRFHLPVNLAIQHLDSVQDEFY